MIVRLAVVVAVVVVATLVGRWWQSRQGRVRSVATPQDDRVAATAGTTTAAAIREPTSSGTAVRSAVLVTTPTCRSCPQVRDALERVAAGTADFAWSEVDASQDLEFVRTHDVRRAPTVLFRDARDRVVARASGTMTPAQVAEAVTAARWRW